MSLKTPEKLRRLQEALYAKAKREPSCRFYLLYDKMWRGDVLAHAFALCRSNGGAAGVDGQTFDDIEVYGQARWLDELREEVRTSSYRPDAVRRVMIRNPSATYVLRNELTGDRGYVAGSTPAGGVTPCSATAAPWAPSRSAR